MNERNLKDTLFERCSLAAVGGYEKPVRDWIRREAEPYADEIRVDKLGNLMVFRKGRKHLERPLAFFAHMDEPGFLVKKITDDGMVQLVNNTMPAKAIIGKQLEIRRQVKGREGVIYGVAGMKADHLQTPEEQKKTPALDKLLVDIGVTSKEDAEALVRPGDVVVPYVEAELLGCPVDGEDGRFMTGRGLAARGGCAVLLELLKDEPACDCWFVFAVSGENWYLAPGKGAIMASRQLNPLMAVMLHGVETGEGPGVPAEKINCRLGEGAAISLMDGDFVFDRGLRQLVTEEADEAGVLWQYHTGKKQVTGAGRLAAAGEGCFLLPVNLPLRYTGAEGAVCALSDLASMADVCRIMMEKAGEIYE